MRENPQLVRELKELLQEYFERNNHITVHAFSKKCGVASSTLRRLLSGETHNEPQGQTVLGIVSAVTRESNVATLIERSQGEIARKLRACFGNVLPKTEYSPELTQILTDRVAYIIYKLGSNAAGTCVQDVIDLMGVPALETIRELKEHKIIFEENSRIYTAKNNFMLPEWLIKKHVPELLRFSNTGSRYVSKSCFYSLSESINEMAYEEVRQILVGAVRQIRQVIKNEKSIGEIPFFLTSVLDTMEVNNETIPNEH